MNVVFFVPLGFFLAYRFRRSVLPSILIAFAVSLAIELTQGTGLWGLAPCPYRLADVDDLMTNTLGGFVGWLIGMGIRRWLPDPNPLRQADPGPPGLVREGVGVLLDVYVYVLVVVLIVIIGLLFDFRIATNNLRFAFTNAAVSLLLFVVIPSLRKDRAGPGVAAVHMILVKGWDVDSPAERWSLLIRWLIRWLPVVFFGLVWLALIVPIDFLVAGLSPGRRSLSMRLSRSIYATREHGAGANRSNAPDGDL